MLNKWSAIKEVQQLTGRIDPAVFIVALLASLAASLAASWMYSYFYERRGTGSQINRAFPLLGISITTLFVGVQVSLPLSLGLLGALSIIRFRTPIKEPEEVGFIMLVIAASITCATFNFQFLVILYAVAVVTLFLLRGRRHLKGGARDGMIFLSLPEEELQRGLEGIETSTREKTRYCFLESSTTKDGMASLQYTFSGLRCSIAELQKDLAGQAALSSVNIFFNRPGGIS